MSQFSKKLNIHYESGKRSIEEFLDDELKFVDHKYLVDPMAWFKKRLFKKSKEELDENN